MDLTANERLGATATSSAASVETSVSAVSWSAIIAGAVVATSVSLVLLTLAAGLGFAAVAPWANRGPSLTEFSVTTAVALIVVQWLASFCGGYITGRLRTKWTGTHTHEVFFRDTAHGFIMWALATIIIATLLTSVVSSLAGGSAQGAAAVSGEISDAARKASAAASVFTALSMVVGAFIASVSAALGGRLRDEHP